jgi:hypothetical protein
MADLESSRSASKSAFNLLGRIFKLHTVATVTCGETELFTFDFSSVGESRSRGQFAQTDAIAKAIDANVEVLFGLFFPLF